jgi:hypothetical protein
MRVLEKSSLNAILKQTGNTMTRTWTMPSLPIIVEHPAEAKKMGKNGWRGVEERYNWGMEEKKLLYLYQELLA